MLASGTSLFTHEWLNAFEKGPLRSLITSSAAIKETTKTGSEVRRMSGIVAVEPDISRINRTFSRILGDGNVTNVVSVECCVVPAFNCVV